MILIYCLYEAWNRLKPGNHYIRERYSGVLLRICLVVVFGNMTLVFLHSQRVATSALWEWLHHCLKPAVVPNFYSPFAKTHREHWIRRMQQTCTEFMSIQWITESVNNTASILQKVLESRCIVFCSTFVGHCFGKLLWKKTCNKKRTSPLHCFSKCFHQPKMFDPLNISWNEHLRLWKAKTLPSNIA